MIINIDGIFNPKKTDFNASKLRDIEPNENEVKLCELFIDKFCDYSDKYYHGTSYGVKHTVEAFVGSYISNGALIKAFVNKNYRVSIIEAGPNCKIGFRIKPKFKSIFTPIRNISPHRPLNILNENELYERVGQLLMHNQEH
ncbi:MAG: hypothetical protein BWY19_00764 [bacterium ADurb.Bin212]|nr:MAG: hypothetical protein BWY19_00764 [bacterium ADurb.Bin212]